MYTESERLLNRISFAWNTFSIFILRLISIAPQFNSYYANAHFSRALARMNLGQNQSAIDDLTEAIRINCRHAKAYNTRGIIRSELGYNQDAIADYSHLT
jgi:tetratricopeptide (TPR) repeat protein